VKSPWGFLGASYKPHIDSPFFIIGSESTVLLDLKNLPSGIHSKFLVFMGEG
jgi:hypothetical protein